jgi:hypothetical protein
LLFHAAMIPRSARKTSRAPHQAPPSGAQHNELIDFSSSCDTKEAKQRKKNSWVFTRANKGFSTSTHTHRLRPHTRTRQAGREGERKHFFGARKAKAKRKTAPKSVAKATTIYFSSFSFDFYEASSGVRGAFK